MTYDKINITNCSDHLHIGENIGALDDLNDIPSPYLTGMLDDEGGIILKTYKDAEGKFGRILGELWRTTEYGDQSINQYLVDKHHAVRYYGQSKSEMVSEH